MTICSACSTSRAIAAAARDGAGRALLSGHALPLRARAADRRAGAAAARLGRARRQWRAGRRSRQCRPPRRGGARSGCSATRSMPAGSSSCAAPPATSGSACAASGRSGSRSRSTLAFAADFADLFEVRGERRRAARRARRRSGRTAHGALHLSWRSTTSSARPPSISIRRRTSSPSVMRAGTWISTPASGSTSW